MAEKLFTVSTALFVLAAVFLIIAIILWIKFKIPDIVGDLTGKTAKKSIALMRESNAKKNDRVFRLNMVPERRSPQGGKTEEIDGTVVLSENLEGSDSFFAEETMVLNTVELFDMNEFGEQEQKGEKLVMLDEVMLIHTDEVI